MRLIRVLMLLCAACLFGVPAGCGGYAKDGDKKEGDSEGDEEKEEELNTAIHKIEEQYDAI